MLQRLVSIHAALALITVAGVACQTYPAHKVGSTSFAVADPELAAELRDAAEDWHRSGLDVAAYVTVNQDDGAVPVFRVTRDEWPSFCHGPKVASAWYATGGGCTMYDDNRLISITVPDDLSPERLAVVLRHELIHAIVPDAEHVLDAPAIFSDTGTSDAITGADLHEMARHTLVVTAE